MILRIFQVEVQPGKRAEFARFFYETAIPLMRGTEGIVEVFPGAPWPSTPDAFCFVMIWRDLEALKAFVGEDYESPHVHPDEAALVKARQITHYELVA